MGEYPDFVARFYDVIYDAMRSPVDHDFYLTKMKTCGGRVLEIGVGTGRIFAEARLGGVDIYGMDVSPSMIERARMRASAEDHHRLLLADVRDFTYDGPFDLMVAPFRVMSHLQTPEDQLKALNCIARHLSANGAFIFDLFVPDPEICKRGLPPTTDFDGFWKEGHYLRRGTSAEPDFVRQTNHVNMRYEWFENLEHRSESWSFDMRYFFGYELEHLIARSDLVLDRIEGDFKGSPLDSNSRDFVVFCRPKFK